MTGERTSGDHPHNYFHCYTCGAPDTTLTSTDGGSTWFCGRCIGTEPHAPSNLLGIRCGSCGELVSCGETLGEGHTWRCGRCIVKGLWGGINIDNLMVFRCHICDTLQRRSPNHWGCFGCLAVETAAIGDRAAQELKEAEAVAKKAHKVLHNCMWCSKGVVKEVQGSRRWWSCPECTKKNRAEEALAEATRVMEERAKAAATAAADAKDRAKMDLFHPEGSCTCGGEGKCAWCLMDLWRARAEQAEAEVVYLQRSSLRAERTLIEERIRKVSTARRKSTSIAADLLRIEQINEELDEESFREGKNTY